MKINALFLASVGVILYVSFSNGEDPLLVETRSGAVRGKFTLIRGGYVRAFLGIPFAKPPVGSQRFRPPEPVDPWKSEYDATRNRAPCMQQVLNVSGPLSVLQPTGTPSENCLYMNIWTPVQNRGARKPVLVFFYGGGFVSGSIDIPWYDGSSMALHTDAVVVTMNYRLGVFGFLDAGIPEAPGNAGLLDQNLAMRWISENIEQFGGDSSQITLMGASAGSMSVSMHVLSPMSKALFQRGIMIGGSAMTAAVVETRASNLAKGYALAKSLGCAKRNEKLNTVAIVKCLTEVPAETIFATSLTFKPTFGNSFLPNDPRHSNASLNISPVEVILGNSNDEGSMFIVNPSATDFFPRPEIKTKHQGIHLAKLALQNFNISLSQDKIEPYFNDTNTEDALLQAVIDIVSDVVMHCPSMYFADKLAAHGNPTYFYKFSYRSPKAMTPDWMGVSHGSDFSYFYGLPYLFPNYFTEEDQKLSGRMMASVSRFLRSGNPRSLSGVSWSKYNEQQRNVLEIDIHHSKMREHPRKDFCEYWKRTLDSISETFVST